jgi:regulatory protein
MQENKSRRLSAGRLWEYALKSLSARAQSIGELREKLRRRAERVGDIEPVLARLKDIGYLNDKRFAESFASARLSNQGLGRMRVVQELRVRRVAPAVAERTVEKVYQEVDEQKLIEDFIRRKYRTAPREGLFQDRKDLASAYRRMARAGFRTGGIVTALKRFAKDPELLDGFEPPEEAAEE